MVENLGNMTETFVLVNSSTDEPDVQSLDADSVTLDAGESSGRVVGDKFETLKLNVSASTPGVYRVDVDATSSFDATVKDSIETWTIVQGEVGSVTKINATIIDSALIDSSITDSTVTNSAINNSIISGSTITNSIIKDSEVVGTPLSDVMLEDAVVTNGKIASGTITLYSSPGITFVITREIPISTLLIGSDYRNSDLVGLKYVTSDKSLSVSGDNSGTGFDIYARDDYFAGSLSAQRSTIPPFGFKELDYNIGGYVFVAPSKNVESSTDLVTIKLYYDPALSQELINRLTIMYYNEQAGKWQPIAVSGINLIEKYVYGKVPHWSVFALMAQTPTPSGPSGPGVFAGGGGAAPSVPGEMTIPIANPGTNIFHFEVLGLDVLTVSINLESTTFKAKVAMESTDKPVGIPDCPGTAYSYFDISTNLEAENINAATINFRVSKSWALINGVDSIRMYRYANGWQELKTLKITEDDEYIYFAAETPGLSLFVISSEEKGVEIAPPATPTPTLIPATPAPTPIPPAEPLLGTRMIAILVAIAALAIVSVAYLMLRRRRP
jgi:PGF-pre-PGF domain-containing protein